MPKQTLIRCALCVVLCSGTSVAPAPSPIAVPAHVEATATSQVTELDAERDLLAHTVNVSGTQVTLEMPPLLPTLPSLVDIGLQAAPQGEPFGVWACDLWPDSSLYRGSLGECLVLSPIAEVQPGTARRLQVPAAAGQLRVKLGDADDPRDARELFTVAVINEVGAPRAFRLNDGAVVRWIPTGARFAVGGDDDAQHSRSMLWTIDAVVERSGETALSDATRRQLHRAGIHHQQSDGAAAAIVASIPINNGRRDDVVVQNTVSAAVAMVGPTLTKLWLFPLASLLMLLLEVMVGHRRGMFSARVLALAVVPTLVGALWPVHVDKTASVRVWLRPGGVVGYEAVAVYRAQGGPVSLDRSQPPLLVRSLEAMDPISVTVDGTAVHADLATRSGVVGLWRLNERPPGDVEVLGPRQYRHSFLKPISLVSCDGAVLASHVDAGVVFDVPAVPTATLRESGFGVGVERVVRGLGYGHAYGSGAGCTAAIIEDDDGFTVIDVSEAP